MQVEDAVVEIDSESVNRGWVVLVEHCGRDDGAAAFSLSPWSTPTMTVSILVVVGMHSVKPPMGLPFSLEKTRSRAEA